MEFTSGFTAASRFHLMEYHVSEMNLHGIGIIFRQFDHPSPIYFENTEEYCDEPDEYFAGWMPLERKQDAEKWVILLNEIVAKKLVGNHLFF